jgi:hypothetical protein
MNIINKLNKGEIFVFGSNLSGIHGAGAARIAYNKFGAKWGVGIGRTGNCYAIPTKSEGIKRTLTINEISLYVNEFILYAIENSELTFLVTDIGCGLAGYKIHDIEPLFKNTPKNCRLLWRE